MQRVLLLLLAGSMGTAVLGCDKLFPELTGMPPDMVGTGDGGADLGGTSLTGKVCVLADLRAPQSCQVAAVGRRLTIEENRASADVAADGSFTISLAGVVDTATLAVSDGTGGVGRSTTTISVLAGAQLTAARSQGVMLPVVDAQILGTLSLATGAGNDPTRGAIIAWVVDGTGVAVRGAEAARIQGAVGPLYDSPGSNTLGEGGASGGYGTIGFLDVTPGKASISISAPLGAAVRGDAFTLPVRGGAVTLSALGLPPL